VKQLFNSAKSAVKVGITDTAINFSQPVTLSIDVESSYNGAEMHVFYQEDGDDQWYEQTTCIITDGKCSFQTTHATTYTVNGDGAMVGQTGTNINTTIAETISLNCTNDTVPLGTLTPGLPLTANSVCSVTSNANGGYTLSVKRDDASSTLDRDSDATTKIDDKNQWNPTTPNAQSWTGTGLGFTVYSAPNKESSWWGTGTNQDDPNNLYAGFPTTQTNIMQYPTYSSTATETHIGYKLDVPTTQKSGTYSGTVTYQTTTAP
jgi:hypothetical protein